MGVIRVVRRWGSLNVVETCSPLSAAYESARRLLLPRVGEEFAEELAINVGQDHTDRRQPLAPPHVLAGIGRALDCRQYPALIQHHVHPARVPQRREDLASDTKRRAPVMVQLDGLGQRKGKSAGFVSGDGHGPAEYRGFGGNAGSQERSGYGAACAV